MVGAFALKITRFAGETALLVRHVDPAFFGRFGMSRSIVTVNGFPWPRRLFIVSRNAYDGTLADPSNTGGLRLFVRETERW